MALNVTFTCNTIYDETSNKIDCNYQAYHHRSGTWNTVKQSQFNQYSFNAGDGDFLTQTGELLVGDEITITFWQDSTNVDRTGLKTRFCSFNLIHDGSNTYIIDPQLKPKIAPTCGFSLTSNSTINTTVSAISGAYDSYSWVFSSVTFYHEYSYNSIVLFDSVGIKTTQYDFQNGYNSTNTYAYSVINDYTVYQKVTNYYGLSSICNTSIHITYNPPSMTFSHVPNSSTTPILGDTVDITGTVQDIDNTVSTTANYIDTVLTYTSITDIYTFSSVLSINHTYAIYSDITWYDGFLTQHVITNYSISLYNVPPTIDLIVSNIGAIYSFNGNPFDHEDELDYVKYSLAVDSNAILEANPTTHAWTTLSEYISTAPLTNSNTFDYTATATFYKDGVFRIQGIAYDKQGKSSIIQEQIFTVNLALLTPSTQTSYFDWGS